MKAANTLTTALGSAGAALTIAGAPNPAQAESSIAVRTECEQLRKDIDTVALPIRQEVAAHLLPDSFHIHEVASSTTLQEICDQLNIDLADKLEKKITPEDLAEFNDFTLKTNLRIENEADFVIEAGQRLVIPLGTPTRNRRRIFDERYVYDLGTAEGTDCTSGPIIWRLTENATACLDETGDNDFALCLNDAFIQAGILAADEIDTCGYDLDPEMESIEINPQDACEDLHRACVAFDEFRIDLEACATQAETELQGLEALKKVRSRLEKVDPTILRDVRKKLETQTDKLPRSQWQQWQGTDTQLKNVRQRLDQVRKKL